MCGLEAVERDDRRRGIRTVWLVLIVVVVVVMMAVAVVVVVVMMINKNILDCLSIIIIIIIIIIVFGEIGESEGADGDWRNTRTRLCARARGHEGRKNWQLESESGRPPKSSVYERNYLYQYETSRLRPLHPGGVRPLERPRVAGMGRPGPCWSIWHGSSLVVGTSTGVKPQ